MSEERIYLGRVKRDAGTYADGEMLFLSKHEWQCSWYWGFGYLGNRGCHFHFESLLELRDKYMASDIFVTTNITDKEWWVIRDLFIQAYAMKALAEVYRYGGHQTTLAGVTDKWKDLEKADAINRDLGSVLDVIWAYVTVAAKEMERV